MLHLSVCKQIEDYQAMNYDQSLFESKVLFVAQSLFSINGLSDDRYIVLFSRFLDEMEIENDGEDESLCGALALVEQQLLSGKYSFEMFQVCYAL